jgi:hypothetical protein
MESMEAFAIAFLVGMAIFCIELVKRIGRIALALEKLAGIPPRDFTKPGVS